MDKEIYKDSGEIEKKVVSKEFEHLFRLAQRKLGYTAQRNLLKHLVLGLNENIKELEGQIDLCAEEMKSAKEGQMEIEGI